MEIKLGGYRPSPEGIEYIPFDKTKLSNNLLTNNDDIDLRSYSLYRHDQKNSSSCVAQSTIKALEIKRVQKYGADKHIPLSVLALYWLARDRMNPKETLHDDGTYIHLACEVLKTSGICHEAAWPFNLNKLSIDLPIMALREAYLNKINEWTKIDSSGWDRVDDIIANLKVGNPVVYGTLVGQTWFNYTANSEPLNITKPEDAKGAHATCIVGWDTLAQCFIGENSWGNFWGHNGFYYIRPEVIIDSNSNDFHVIMGLSEDNEER